MVSVQMSGFRLYFSRINMLIMKTEKKLKSPTMKEGNMKKLREAIRQWHEHEAVEDENVEEKMRSFGMID